MLKSSADTAINVYTVAYCAARCAKMRIIPHTYAPVKHEERTPDVDVTVNFDLTLHSVRKTKRCIFPEAFSNNMRNM